MARLAEEAEAEEATDRLKQANGSPLKRRSGERSGSGVTLNNHKHKRKNTMGTENGCQMYVPQWQEKLGWRLFPANHIDPPRMEKSRDVLICKTVAHLSIMDRLRVLISGKIRVTTKTTTEHIIGDHVTDSGIEMLPPSYLSRRDSK